MKLFFGATNACKNKPGTKISNNGNKHSDYFVYCRRITKKWELCYLYFRLKPVFAGKCYSFAMNISYLHDFQNEVTDHAPEYFN